MTTTGQAAVTTVSVAVKTIQINNKQMTLSVFRQLIAEQPDLNIEQLVVAMWGTVNYHGCGDCIESEGRNHLHIVWQKDDKLRRWTIFESSCSSTTWGLALSLPQLFIAV